MLRFKLFKWFGAVVLVFGALAAYLGIRIIGDRVVQEAQKRVERDLSSARDAYDSRLGDLKLIVSLSATRPPLIEACDAANWSDPSARAEIEALLGRTRSEFNLDFITILSTDARAVARGASPHNAGDYRAGDPLVAAALAGKAGCGAEAFTREELDAENPKLVEKAFLEIKETLHARPTPRTVEDRGLVMLAAAPIVKTNRVVGVVYAGRLLNKNDAFVDGVKHVIFGEETYAGRPVGTVTVFLGDTRVTTTVKLENGNRALGTRVSREVAERVLDNGKNWVDRAFVVRDWYLTAYEPIHNPADEVIGMLYVGILEQPFSDMRRSTAVRFASLVAIGLAAALIIAFVIAGRVARPLHQLAETAKGMQMNRPFQPVSSPGGCRETSSLISAFNDMAHTLTDRERDLKEANERLGAANTSLSVLNKDYMEALQFVSHELKSPIAALINYNYVLRQGLHGPLTEKQARTLGAMDDNLHRLTDMVRHYLNLARIESGEMAPSFASVALRDDVLEPVLAGLDASLRAGNRVVENMVPHDLRLAADHGMLRELFENLLSNAVKYGRDGGRIQLSARIQDGWVECAVRNDGDGIPPERMDELFRKFSRLEQLGQTRGAGLGLFICSKIMQAHGGTIRAGSRPGEWAEFICRFPQQRDTAGAPEPPAPETGKVPHKEGEKP